MARLDSLFAPLAEASGVGGSDAEFEIHGNTLLASLAAMYDLVLTGLDGQQTIAQLFAERFDAAPDIGDQLPLGNCILTVRKLDGDAVAEAALRFDEEAKPRPAPRAVLRRLIGRRK